MKARARIAKQSVCEDVLACMKVLCICIAMVRSCARIARFQSHHWQASQPGSSIAQNLMSVAGALFICACAAAAAASSALMPPDAAPEDTALSWPAEMVDFSACVALVVRR